MTMNMPISVCFTGDIAFSGYYANGKDDASFIAPEIRDFLGHSDYCVFNVEGAIAVRGDSSKGRFYHVSHPSLVAVLKELSPSGRAIWNLANNHAMDGGMDGLCSTMRYAEEEHSRIIGGGANLAEASKPCYLEEGGGVGFISICQNESGCHGKLATENDPGVFGLREQQLIQSRIKEIKGERKWCVVVIHAGREFTSMPTPYIRNQYLQILDWGADVIVAHHPHVVQNYELVGEKLIFYSLGNFIFDTDYQRAAKYSDTGVLLKLTFSSEKITWEAMGIHISRNETGSIESCALPVIFTDVDEKLYRTLRYEAAWDYFVALTRSRISISKRKSPKWLIDLCMPLKVFKSIVKHSRGNQDMRQIPISIILHLCRFKKRSDNSISRYLNR